MKLKGAHGAIRKGLLAYCDLAIAYWARIRTKNAIKMWYHTRVVGSFANGNATLMNGRIRLQHMVDA